MKTSNLYDYDFLVIGGGAAGNGAANEAREAGKSVAIIERDRIGGTCTNYGCDPTKFLLHAATLMWQPEHASRFGVELAQAQLNWPLLQAKLRRRIDEQRGGSKEEVYAGYEKRGIDLIRGEAVFSGAHTVSVNGSEISAETILITTGTEPLVPSVEGLEEAGYLTNKNAPFISKLPASMIIVGAGAVGTEFAWLFNCFGVKVTLIESAGSIVPPEDDETTNHLADRMKGAGIEIITQAKLVRVGQPNGLKRGVFELASGYEQVIEAEEILIATGRRSTAETLNVAAAGIETDNDGWVVVNDGLQTSVPHIYAAGDIIGGFQFTHVANQAGGFAARNALQGTSHPFNRDPIPRVVYTSPELAAVGKTETQLRRAGTDYRVVRLDVADVARAQLVEQTGGMIKMLLDDHNHILGVHILSQQAGDMIALPTLAMRHNLPVDTLANMTMAYPTWVEGLKWAAMRA